MQRTNVCIAATVLLAGSVALANVAVVDNSDGNFSIEAGGWVSSTGAPGFFDVDYRHDGNAQGGSSVRWTLPIGDTPGSYQVFVRWTEHPNRATNAAYTVNHAEGSTQFFVDQQVNGGTFVLLGEFTDPTSVTLSNQGANGYVIADAVKAELSVPMFQFGEAFVPFWSASPAQDKTTNIWVRNITDDTVDVTVTLYERDGSMRTGTSATTVAGEGLAGSPDYNPAGATVSFSISPRGGVSVTTLITGSSSGGWGTIHWEADLTTGKALLAHAAWLRVAGTTQARFSIPINQGLPF